MELSWIITALLGLVFMYLFYWLFTMNSNYWEKRGMPYVKSPPLVGVLWDFLLKRKGLGEIFTDLYRASDGNKFIGYFQLLSPNIMLRDPELINQVLIKDFTYFEDRGPPMKDVDDLFSFNLSNLTGDEWRNVRHKLTPTFTSGKLKMMFTPIKECGDELVRYIETKEGQDLEARDVSLKFILNVIANVAFGLKLDTFNDNDQQSQDFFNKSTRFFQPSTALFFKFMIAMTAPKVRRLLKLRMMDDDVETFFRKLTHDVVEYRESTNARRNDFLQLMLDLKKQSSDVSPVALHNKTESEPVEIEDKELLDQLKNTPVGSKGKEEIFTENFISCQTFLFISGGSETTASVLNFVIYELALNQDLQKRVQDEISSVLSSHEFDYQAVRKMTYMEQFIYESLRLHPIAPVLMRVCTRDYKIPGTEFVIPKGMFVNVPAGGLHKDAQYFPDPEKFNPDRFEDMDSIPKGVFFPFGSGPRICIAMRLAMLEMKLFLTIVLRNYNIVLSEKTKVPLKLMKSSFIIRPEGGTWIQFQKRKL